MVEGTSTHLQFRRDRWLGDNQLDALKIIMYALFIISGSPRIRIFLSCINKFVQGLFLLS